MLMQSTDKEALPRRTGATECLGLIAEALGKDLMGPLVPGIMEAAFQVGAGVEVVKGCMCSPCIAARWDHHAEPKIWLSTGSLNRAGLGTEQLVRKLRSMPVSCCRFLGRLWSCPWLWQRPPASPAALGYTSCCPAEHAAGRQ